MVAEMALDFVDFNALSFPVCDILEWEHGASKFEIKNCPGCLIPFTSCKHDECSNKEYWGIRYQRIWTWNGLTYLALNFHFWIPPALQTDSNDCQWDAKFVTNWSPNFKSLNFPAEKCFESTMKAVFAKIEDGSVNSLGVSSSFEDSISCTEDDLQPRRIANSGTEIPILSNPKLKSPIEGELDSTNRKPFDSTNCSIRACFFRKGDGTKQVRMWWKLHWLISKKPSTLFSLGSLSS